MPYPSGIEETCDIAWIVAPASIARMFYSFRFTDSYDAPAMRFAQILKPAKLEAE